MGLVDKLKMASTATVVENLLADGTRFSDASEKTKRRWRYVATRRLKEIQMAQEEKSASDKKAESSKKLKNSRK